MASRKSSTLLPHLEKHQQLYKGTTPPWKDTYRKVCYSAQAMVLFQTKINATGAQ